MKLKYDIKRYLTLCAALAGTSFMVSCDGDDGDIVASDTSVSPSDIDVAGPENISAFEMELTPDHVAVADGFERGPGGGGGSATGQFTSANRYTGQGGRLFSLVYTPTASGFTLNDVLADDAATESDFIETNVTNELTAGFFLGAPAAGGIYQPSDVNPTDVRQQLEAIRLNNVAIAAGQLLLSNPDFTYDEAADQIVDSTGAVSVATVSATGVVISFDVVSATIPGATPNLTNLTENDLQDPLFTIENDPNFPGWELIIAAMEDSDVNALPTQTDEADIVRLANERITLIQSFINDCISANADLDAQLDLELATNRFITDRDFTMTTTSAFQNDQGTIFRGTYTEANTGRALERTVATAAIAGTTFVAGDTIIQLSSVETTENEGGSFSLENQ